MESLKNTMPIDECYSYCTNLLDTIFRECSDGIVYKDKNFNYLSANKAFCEIFEIKNLSTIVGQDKFPFLNKENQKLIESVNKEVAKEKHSINYIFNVYEKILNITTSPIYAGEDFLGVFSIVKDITHEESLKEKFVVKHFQLKSLLENIPMLIYMQDKNFNYIAGTKHSWSFVTNGYDSFKNLHLDLKKNSEESKDDNNFVVKNNKILEKVKEFIDQKGTPHWYKIYKIPINDFYGNVTGVITLADNIDIEKRLQAQKETFVATLGHDLKNPTIAQIRGLELLLKGSFGELSKEQTELLEMVLDSCRYMNGMLASLLATYRDCGGMIKLNFEQFSFLDLVNECVSEMIYVAKDKGIEIHIENKFINKKITADRVQVKRVIMNLLSNGIKYAFKETPLILSIYTDATNAYFSFKNQSPYINEEKQKSIFAQYVTYATANDNFGIGLGLYASKKIIEAHNGEMFVKSSKNNTNTFGFNLPIYANNRKTEVCF